MKELKFKKPMAVEEISKDGNIGKFQIKPLERGYGITLGNALRRVLLSSLPGAAIVNVKIEGVEHEFTAIEGVYEDVIGIILNLKKVIFQVDSNDPSYEQRLEIFMTGPAEVKASDFNRVDGITVVNPDQVICTLAKDATLQMEVTVRRGMGYVNAQDNKKHNKDTFGMIAIDSTYSPINRVSYNVEKARNDNDELTIEIETNGSISAKDSLALASKMLIDYFNEIVKISENIQEESFVYEQEEEPINKKLELKIEQLELSVRLYNSLKRSGIASVADIVRHTEDEVKNFKGLGKNSYKELEAKLEEYGLAFANARELDYSIDGKERK